MSTPYDDEPHKDARTDAAAQCLRIRDLNDALRKSEDGIMRLVTEAVNSSSRAALPPVEMPSSSAPSRPYARSMPSPADNDPYGEHDFGIFELDGTTLNWKIDYYDNELE